MSLPRAILFFAFVASLSLSGCGLVPDHWWPGSKADTSALLAKVGDRELRASEIGNLVVAGTAAEDSLRILRDYVERWTRDASVLNHAAVDLGSDTDIDKLVDDYRGSLQRHRMEERLIREGVDTVVSGEEIAERYAAMQEGYAVPHELVRAFMLKIPRNSEALDDIDEAWRDISQEQVPDALRALSAKHADLALLDPKRWFEAAELQALLPKDAEDISRGSRVSDVGDHRYYLRVLERVARGSRSPLAYLEPRLRKMILEERRGTFLNTYVDQVYQDAKANDEIEIYVGQ